MNLREYRRSTTQLADFLPWAALVDEGIVLNKDGSFQRTAKFRGPDLDSAVPAELVGVAGRLNNALRRLGSGWAVFVEAQRNPASNYPEGHFPDVASALVDVERRAEFEQEGAHYESNYFLTFLYLPPAEEPARAERFLYEGRDRGEDADAREVQRGFVDRTERVLGLVEGFMPEIAWFDDDGTLTYLHSTVSTKRQRVRVPEIPMYLDAVLADQPLTGGLEPMLGDAHLRVLTLVGFPTVDHARDSRRTQSARLRLPLVDPRDHARQDRGDQTADQNPPAMVRQTQIHRRDPQGGDDQRGLGACSIPMPTTRPWMPTPRFRNSDPTRSGKRSVTATVTVWDDDPRVADDKLRMVEKVIQGRDFTCMVESVNAVEAWLGSLPGHVYANVRQPPVSTLNLAHMIPLSAVWAGPARDEHFGAPPLFFAKTEGATPFRFSLHVGDVGHTLVVGPTGAGKSVLLALMALQFRRYRRTPRSSPSISAARSARPRSPWVATGMISAARCRMMPPSPSRSSPWP